jgi:hypothetical protein
MILNPLGDGAEFRVVNNSSNVIILRQTFNELLGNYLLSDTSTQTGSMERRFEANGSTITAHDVVYVSGGDNRIKQTPTAGAPIAWPLVAAETGTAGTDVAVALSGSIMPVACDAVAVTAGDQLVSSGTTAARGTADNSVTDSRKVIGIAVTGKGASAGSVNVLVK